MIQISFPVTRAVAATFIVFSTVNAQVAAQPGSPGYPVPTMPAVTLSASATASVPNDHMLASMHAESDNVDAAAAASVVNSRRAKALGRAKATKGVEVSTSGYSSWQTTYKN